jgi:Ca-activated chloride channel family protein
VLWRHRLFLAATFCGATPAICADWVSERVHIEPRVPAPREIPHSDFRTGVTVALINVTVRDRANHLVTGLEREDFRLFENRVEQQIKYFANEDSAVSIGVIFDASGSMAEKVGLAREAVAELLKPSNYDDEFFLIRISDRPDIAADFTNNGAELQSRLLPVVSKGRTSLLDGIYLGLQQMKRARNQRKALIVLSDGGDNHSRYSRSEVMNLTRESDVQIHAIGLFEPTPTREQPAATLKGPLLLAELAEETGGRHAPVTKISALPDIAHNIGSAIRRQYLLGYTPTDLTRDGKYRRVQVSIAPQRSQHALRVDWKRGYFAPNQ